MSWKDEMSMEKSELAKEINKSLASSTQDHIVSGIKAAISAVPIIGGAVASLISDYIPRTREARLKEFLIVFTEELSKATAISQSSIVETERFAGLLTKTLRSVADTHDKEKIALFRAFLVNAAVAPISDEDVETMFLARLHEMTMSHLKVLALFGDPYKNIKHQFDLKNEGIPLLIGMRAILENVPELGESSGKARHDPKRHVHALVEDLDRWGFLDNPLKYEGSVDQAEGLIDYIDGFLTSFGRDFLKYIETEHKDTPGVAGPYE